MIFGKTYKINERVEGNNPENIYRNFLKGLFNEEQELFILLCQDINNKVMTLDILFAGGRDSSVVDQKVVFKKALMNNASKIVIAHNHPSGGLEPSFEDKFMTKGIKKGAELLGIKFNDHLIFNHECARSMFFSGDIK